MKPHFGHLYVREKLRHFMHRQMVISPQLGQANFVASAPGVIILLQEVHMGTVTLACSLNLSTSDEDA